MILEFHSNKNILTRLRAQPHSVVFANRFGISVHLFITSATTKLMNIAWWIWIESIYATSLTPRTTCNFCYASFFKILPAIGHDSSFISIDWIECSTSTLMVLKNLKQSETRYQGDYQSSPQASCTGKSAFVPSHHWPYQIGFHLCGAIVFLLLNRSRF